jgi:hypothetical protein
METEVMKHRYIQMLACSVGIMVYAATGAKAAKFSVILPNGTMVELIGLRNFSMSDLEKFKNRNYPWWKPDGTVLANPPDTWKGRTSQSGSYWFVFRVKGDKNCDFKAVGPYNDDLTVQPVRRKTPGFQEDDLRYFPLEFAPNQKQGDVKLGIASGDWKMVHHWSFDPKWTPYNHTIGSGDQLILRCPEQVGSDVVAEVTQIITERATRLVLFDRNGHKYESQGEIGGIGVGLIRYVHRFRNFDKKNIKHMEFHVRPYQYWITFSNVSLQVGHKTQAKVDIKQPGALLKSDALPGFDDFELDLNVEEIEDKKLLICFFDMNQRPSRNCINELRKRTRQFKEKEVTVIVVQTSQTNQDRLNEWTKENNIPFSNGMIKKDVEKTRFTWGVKSLPWLILTDNQHFVIDAGFRVGELDDKIKE